MRQNGFKYVVRRLRVPDKEPVVTELIVNIKVLPTKVKDYPRLGEPVRQNCNVCDATEAFDVPTQFLSAHRLRQFPQTVESRRAL
jgi:hypothetical protein